MKPIGRLHVLTDTVLQKNFSHSELTSLAVSGGVDTVQFRQKKGTTRDMIRTAQKMKSICEKSGVTFIVNDRIDVAIASGADGVHLGQDDFPVSLARELLGDDRIIGGSAATIEEAQICFSEGVDYIGFGPVYATSSKNDAGPVSGLKILKQVVREIPLPVIVIGGIDADNAADVMKAGAYGVAVISAVCCQENPEEATIELSEAVKKYV